MYKHLHINSTLYAQKSKCKYLFDVYYFDRLMYNKSVFYAFLPKGGENYGAET